MRWNQDEFITHIYSLVLVAAERLLVRASWRDHLIEKKDQHQNLVANANLVKILLQMALDLLMLLNLMLRPMVWLTMPVI